MPTNEMGRSAQARSEPPSSEGGEEKTDAEMRELDRQTICDQHEHILKLVALNDGLSAALEAVQPILAVTRLTSAMGERHLVIETQVAAALSKHRDHHPPAHRSGK